MAEPTLEAQLNRLGRKLDKMADKVVKQHLTKALRFATTPTAKELRNEIKAELTDEKRLQKTIGTHITREGKRGGIKGVTRGTATSVVARVGQKKTARKSRGAVHIHLADQDTAAHPIPGATFMGEDGVIRTWSEFDHPGTTGPQLLKKVEKRRRNQTSARFGERLAQLVESEV